MLAPRTPKLKTPRISPTGLRIVTGGDDAFIPTVAPRATAHPLLLYIALVLTAATFVAGFGYWRYAIERSAIADLPHRREVFERTLANLESACASATRSTTLEQYCTEQASFVVKFPECDAQCNATVSRTRHLPPAR